jgi:hypothetical protein
MHSSYIYLPIRQLRPSAMIFIHPPSLPDPSLRENPRRPNKQRFEAAWQAHKPPAAPHGYHREKKETDGSPVNAKQQKRIRNMQMGGRMGGVMPESVCVSCVNNEGILLRPIEVDARMVIEFFLFAELGEEAQAEAHGLDGRGISGYGQEVGAGHASGVDFFGLFG